MVSCTPYHQNIMETAVSCWMLVQTGTYFLPTRLYSWTLNWWWHIDTHCCSTIPAISKTGWSIYMLSLTLNSIMDGWTQVSWTLYHWQNLISLCLVFSGIQGERCYYCSIIVLSKFINIFWQIQADISLARSWAFDLVYSFSICTIRLRNAHWELFKNFLMLCAEIGSYYRHASHAEV